MENLKVILDTKTELHKDLRPAVFTDERGMKWIHHRLYVGLFVPGMNSHCNAVYEHKLRLLDELKSRGDWQGYVFIHERPYRLQAFMEIMDGLDDQTYWDTAGRIWVDSENIYEMIDCWREILTSSRSHREYFMDEDERKEFESLPDILTIYRGCIERMNENGFSYTLCHKTAKWFSKRFCQKGAKVIRKRVLKSDVIAYLNGRGEKEIVIVG